MDAEKPPDLDPRVLEIIRSERQKGFLKGLNVAFAVLALFCSSYTAFHTFVFVPRFCNLFGSVQVNVPAITMIVLDDHRAAILLLMIASVACLGLSIKWGDRWTAAIPTIACFFLTMAWMAISMVGLFVPLLSLLEGIGRRP